MKKIKKNIYCKIFANKEEKLNRDFTFKVESIEETELLIKYFKKKGWNIFRCYHHENGRNNFIIDKPEYYENSRVL
jgi:ATP-dependent RNA circularization protein (DNA/RNA ligase family)